MEVSLLQIALVFALLGVALAAVFLISRQLKSQEQLQEQIQAQELSEMTKLSVSLQAANERLERELRNAILESARGGRQELTQTLGTFQKSLVQ